MTELSFDRGKIAAKAGLINACVEIWRSHSMFSAPVWEAFVGSVVIVVE
ncbi:MAG: hypothetical protein IPP80_14455 [Ignavibacteria bacterium]|nr:hypothetical protein [Ignavibacteria bacterium]